MPSTSRLLFCAAGIYVSFLSWALVQERLSTTPYHSDDEIDSNSHLAQNGSTAPRYFRHVVFLNTVQSCFSALAAFAYLVFRKHSNTPWRTALGLSGSASSSLSTINSVPAPQAKSTSKSFPLLFRCFQCALMASIGSPFGYAALRYIDYPTQILGKSCKLVPVMFMNIVLYRRKFATHKYIVVITVTLGISLFMLYANRKPEGHGKTKRAATGNSLFGIALLLVNLLVDGAINSTQDEVFVRYKITGTQMMLWMNCFATLITTSTMLIPLPSIPILMPSLVIDGHGQTEFASALEFIRSHPGVLNDIVLFSAAGATGQLFIFDTLENFGSLTLVTITVTRKLFTMLLSLIVFHHHLTPGQWLGVMTVFAGIGIEAYVKRRESLRMNDKKRKDIMAVRHTGIEGHKGDKDGVGNGNERQFNPIDEKQRLKGN